MARTFHLRIVTPDREAMAADVEEVILPGSDGSFGVLANHTPMLAMLKPGIGEVIMPNGERSRLAITGGYAEVTNDVTTVMARTVEFRDEIDVSRAEESLRRAQERLEKSVSEIDVVRAEAALMRALLRLRVGGKE